MSLRGISAAAPHPATARNHTRDVSSRLRSVPARRMIPPRHIPPAASQPPVCAGIASEVKVAAGVTSLTSGDGALWVSGFGSVSRLDPASDRLIAAIRAPGSDEYSRVAVGEGSVWVTSTSRGVVYRIDPSTDRVTATIHTGGPAQGIAVGGGRIWVTLVLPGPGKLIAIDPRSNHVSGPPITVGPGPGQVVYGQHAVWVQNTSPASVMRINPESGQITTVIGTATLSPGSPGPGAIAVGYRSLWSVANGALTRLAPGGGRTIARIAIPRAVGIVLAEGEVWVLSYPRSSSPTLFEPIKHTAGVWAIDPHTDRTVRQPIRLHALQPIAFTTSEHGLWVADFPSTLTRFRLASCHGHRRPARRRIA